MSGSPLIIAHRGASADLARDAELQRRLLALA